MPVVLKRSKRYKKAAEKAIATPVGIDQAIEAVKAFPPTKFDQSVELIFALGIDPKQADQAIRSSVSLPHGIGKSKRVVAFCPDHLVDAAKAAGAVKAEKGSGEPNKNKIGKITMADCKKIAKEKIKDLNAFDEDHAARIIAGTARSMGITVEG